MARDEQWPPTSPMKALLSSPSGRKRFREHHELGTTSTSPDKLLGSPSLLERLRAARADRDLEILQPNKENFNDEEDDEETLQLKLQAIEAKLKLKKLQQQKARNGVSPANDSKEGTATETIGASARVEVALSPTKRAIDPTSQKSPSRVLLGIDKGLHAADVSLRRAKTIGGSPTRQRVHHVDSRVHRPRAEQASLRSSPAVSTPAKSFSERMAEMRDRERDRESRAATVQSARTSSFRYDRVEMQKYQMSQDQAATQVSQTPQPNGSDYAKLDREESRVVPASRSIKPSHSMPSLRSTSPLKSAKPVQSTISSSTSAITSKSKGDANLYEGLSGTHLSSRILPHTFLKRTLPTEQFKLYTIPKLLKDVTSPDYHIPDDITDYVVFGIIANMSNPRNHKPKAGETNSTSSADWEKKWQDGSTNTQKFLVCTLTDLKWTVDLFLFDSAVPRYHRLTPGTLIAVLNPGIMPPKKGREDTGAFSLAIHDGDDQILEIGKAKHLGFCDATKKDGNKCGQWVNSSKTSICEWHLNAELNRTRSARSGLNKMDGWKPERQPEEKQSKNRQGFDWESQSRYYTVGGSRPKNTNNQQQQQWAQARFNNPTLSTAKLLDMSNPDDPFLAEGQLLERDKADRLRKRMAEMEKEHEIARKLSMFDGTAGGQYMKQRAGNNDTSSTQTSSQATRVPVTSGPGITREDILAARPGEVSKKRAAGSVRLGPVKKKTRFVTEKGIKEAGRESLGVESAATLAREADKVAASGLNEDDDSDLDII